MPFHEGPDCCLELCYQGQRQASGRRLHRGPGSHLKHRISKREYKVVLSKTYIRTILLMLKFQGKGGGVQHAEVPALTWLFLYYEYQKEVRSVHESTTKSPTNTPLWILPRLPHEEARHSTHAYLASFISIHSSCLIIK